MLFNLGNAFERPKPTEVLYIGIVEDNTDPLQMGRIRVRIKEVFGSKIPTDKLPWASPFQSPSAGSAPGLVGIHIPEIDSHVIVAFNKQDIYSPVYTGQPLAKGHLFEDLVENYPHRYGFKDSNLNQFWVDKLTGEIEVKHHSGTRLYIDDEGSVTVDVLKNQTTTIEENATVLVKKNSDITIEENNTLLIKGNNDISVEGDTNLAVSGNAISTVNGTCDMTVDGAATVKVGSLDATVDGSSSITTGAADVTVSGSTKLNSSGNVEVTAPSVNVDGGSSVKLTGTNVEINANTVNLKAQFVNIGSGAIEPLVLGNKLAIWITSYLSTWMNTHSHTGNLGSPTSPPIVPFAPGTAALNGPVYSATNKVK